MVDESLLNQFKKTKPGDLGIFGDPIEHSLSPAMHNAAFQTWEKVLKNRAEPVPHYHRIHVLPHQLKEAVALLKKFKFRGVNVTIPHKVAACELVDKLGPLAKKVGAINTVVNDDGKLKGFNTDGYGFLFSLKTDLSFFPEGKRILLLGAGGAGRVIAFQLVEEKAEKIFWFDSEPEKLESLLRESGKSLPGAEQLFTSDGAEKIAGAVDLVINATPVGLKEGDGLPLDNLKFGRGQFVYDVIYNRTTRFMQEAKAAGAIVAGGLGMLVYQGAMSFNLWTGQPAPIEVMRLALSNSLKKV